VGATISAGVSGGILFTAAHELLHGSHPLDKLGANALLAAVGYMHWCESHLAHHVKVRRRFYVPHTPRVYPLGLLWVQQRRHLLVSCCIGAAVPNLPLMLCPRRC
jgi:hypothetical protein